VITHPLEQQTAITGLVAANGQSLMGAKAYGPFLNLVPEMGTRKVPFDPGKYP